MTERKTYDPRNCTLTVNGVGIEPVDEPCERIPSHDFVASHENLDRIASLYGVSRGRSHEKMESDCVWDQLDGLWVETDDSLRARITAIIKG